MTHKIFSACKHVTDLKKLEVHRQYHKICEGHICKKKKRLKSIKLDIFGDIHGVVRRNQLVPLTSNKTCHTLLTTDYCSTH